MKNSAFLLFTAMILITLVFAGCSNENENQTDTSAEISDTDLTTAQSSTFDTAATTTGTGEWLITLSPDLDAAEYSEGETVLLVPWGETEDTFACQQNMEMMLTYGPQSFVIGDDGIIYVYDSYNTKLKSFKDGLYVGSADLYDINGMGDGVGITSMVYFEGSIYAHELNSDKIYKITGSEADEFDAFGTLGDIINPFEDENGNVLSMICEGQKDCVFIIKNSSGEFVEAVNLDP